MEPSSNSESVIRTAVVWIACACAATVLLAVFLGWFDSADERANGAARKCKVSMTMNLITDATGYCDTAVKIITTESALAPLTIARVHMQAASLHLTQKRTSEAATHCRSAVAAWKQVFAEELYAEKNESINLCGRVIGD